MSKHTEGPWHFLGGGVGVAWAGQGGEADQLICLAELPRSGEFDEHEWLANAHLIAAAPDLLKALSEILPMVETLYGMDGGEKFDSCFESAIAAIFKAESC